MIINHENAAEQQQDLEVLQELVSRVVQLRQELQREREKEEFLERVNENLSSLIIKNNLQQHQSKFIEKVTQLVQKNRHHCTKKSSKQLTKGDSSYRKKASVHKKTHQPELSFTKKSLDSVGASLMTPTLSRAQLKRRVVETHIPTLR